MRRMVATQAEMLVRLMREHQADVWRYLRLLGCDASCADDLTQETFLYVLNHPLNEFSRAQTAAYLRRAARSLMLNLLRRERRVVALDEIEVADNAWNELTPQDGDARIEVLQRCVGKLEGRAKVAVRLRYGDGLSEAEVADKLGATEEAAKALLKRTRAALRECVERQAEHGRP